MMISNFLYNTQLPRTVYKYYAGAWASLNSWHTIGTNVYNRDWDLLILLDTCRVDALQEVKSEYEFLENVDSLLSVGSTSSEWIANTFTKKYREKISQTAYITANGYTQRVIFDREYPKIYIGDRMKPPSFMKDNIAQQKDFQLIDQVWKYSPDNSPGHTLPNYITDRAIKIGRDQNPERMIVHYSQPHAPYIASAINQKQQLYDYEKNPFNALRNGVSHQKVWNEYLENLRFVLDELKVLLENIDSERVVISADHGEAFGEFGVYGHSLGIPHPNVKQVPWAPTKAKDTGNYTPEFEKPDMNTNDVDSHLRALGYK